MGIVADTNNLFVELGAAYADVTNGVWAGAIITLDKLGTPPVPTTVLADDQAEPFSIAIDDSAVYWGDELSGRIMKVPKTGGPAVVLASGTGEIESMAVDDQYVYWVFNSIGNGYVARVPKNP